MFLVYMAAFCSALSFLTGIVAVGSGSHFQFSKRHILQGRRDAILYIWVTFSSIFALAHCAVLANYGIDNDWGYRSHDTGVWMSIHSSVGLLLTSAHLFIRQDLSKGLSDSTFLWGKHRNVGD